jgi:hypothetical protein
MRRVGNGPRRLAVAERDIMRAACAVLDAAARFVNKRKGSVERERALAAMRGQQLAKIDAVVLALTERAAETARSNVRGKNLKPPIGLPELRRAHGARELAQADFDLARRTVEAVEGKLLEADRMAANAKAARRGSARPSGRRGRGTCRGPHPGALACGRGRLLEMVRAAKRRRGPPSRAGVFFVAHRSENNRFR